MQWPFTICDGCLNSSHPKQYSPSYSPTKRSSGLARAICSSSAVVPRWCRGSVVRIQSSWLHSSRCQ